MAAQSLSEVFFIDPTKLNESSGTYKRKLKDGRWEVRCVGQHCYMGEGRGLKKNRNNRRYPGKTTWGPHLEGSSQFQERIKARRVLGQVEHPADGRSNLGASAIVVRKAEQPNSDGQVFIEWETLNTPGGKIIAALLEGNAGFGMSSRGNGTCVQASDGVDEVQGDFEPTTWDCVADESTPGAEVAAQMIRESLDKMVEDAGGDVDEALRRDREMAITALVESGLMERKYSKAAGEFISKKMSILKDEHPEWSHERRVATALSMAREEGYEIPKNPKESKMEDAGETRDNDVMVTVDDEGILPAVQPSATEPEDDDEAPPGGDWVLGTEDGSGHYRCHEVGVAFDVWFYPSAGEPVCVAKGLRTKSAARDAAEAHLHNVVGETKEMQEQAQVQATVPFEGTCVCLRFDSTEEHKKAKSTLEKAGFRTTDKDETGLEVSTEYGDMDSAVNHIRRVLMGADIELDGGPGQMENQHRMRVHEGLVDMVRSIRDMGLRDKQVEELLIANAEMEFGQGAQRRAAADRFYDLHPEMTSSQMRRYIELAADLGLGESRMVEAPGNPMVPDVSYMEEPMAGDMEYMSGEDDEDMGYLDYEYMGEPEPDEMEKYYMEEPDEEVPDEYSYMCRSGHPMEAERKPNRDVTTPMVGDPDYMPDDLEVEENPEDEYGGMDPEDLDLDLDVNESVIRPGDKVRDLGGSMRRMQEGSEAELDKIARELVKKGVSPDEFFDYWMKKKKAYGEKEKYRKRHGGWESAQKGRKGMDFMEWMKSVREDFETGATRKNPALSGAKASKSQPPMASAPQRKNTGVETGGSAEGEKSGGQGEIRPDQRKPKEGGSDLPKKGKGKSEPQKAAKVVERIITRALPDMERAWRMGDGRMAARIGKFIREAARTALHEMSARASVGRVRFLQNEVARLEGENERLRSLTEAMAEVQRTEILEYERRLVLKDHPELKQMERRLARCDTVDEMYEEAKSLLAFRGDGMDMEDDVAEGSPEPARGKDEPIPTFRLREDVDGGPPSASVASSRVEGAPTTPLTEATVASGKELVQERRVAADDPAARLAAHRRRRRRGVR